MIYLTGDEHYNHKNIIKYINRPFNSVDEMNEILIKNHNDIVSDYDFVYHVGDFYFYSKSLPLNKLLKKLKGKHILIKGNHDRYGKAKYLEAGFIDVKKSIFIKKIQVRHKPIKFIDKWHICGHVHKRFIIDNFSINVGVDKWGYRPVGFDIIEMAIEAKKRELDLKIQNHID